MHIFTHEPDGSDVGVIEGGEEGPQVRADQLTGPPSISVTAIRNLKIGPQKNMVHGSCKNDRLFSSSSPEFFFRRIYDF